MHTGCRNLNATRKQLRTEERELIEITVSEIGSPGLEASNEAQKTLALQALERASVVTEHFTMDQAATIVAMGDPQTSLDRVKEVLDRNRLLRGDDQLREDVHLVVLGDYFDFGDHAQRAEAAREGLAVLRFFAQQPEEQVTLIAGNHDLARVGEFISMTDERFSDAVSDAASIYPDSDGGMQEAEFLRRFPEFPSTEVVARDFSAYVVEQRELVLQLLEEKRLRLAAAFDHLLFCHAGVTSEDLRVAGSRTENVTAARAATILNRALDAAWEMWGKGAPFRIPGLHVPGSAVAGEGGGILFHRPSEPSEAGFAGDHRRRYDPRMIPRGLLQVVGHVRDKKCRQLMPSWVVDGAPQQEGQIRGLLTDGTAVSYQTGTPTLSAPNEGGIVFLDGGIHHVPPSDYELFDVRLRCAYRPDKL